MQALQLEKTFNIPNLLTVFRIAMMPLLVWRFCLGDMRGALGAYLIAMVSDVADGMIARRFNLITSVGKLLDPLADKICLMTVLCLFAWDGQIAPWLLWLVLTKEILMIVGSCAALRLGIVTGALPIGKWTTGMFVLSMVARFLWQRTVADILLWLFAALSLVSLIWYSAALIRSISMQNSI